MVEILGTLLMDQLQQKNLSLTLAESQRKPNLKFANDTASCHNCTLALIATTMNITFEAPKTVCMAMATTLKEAKCK